MYEIKAYQGFNDIKFGCRSFEIEKYMNAKPIKFIKSSDDITETDMYDD